MSIRHLAPTGSMPVLPLQNTQRDSACGESTGVDGDTIELSSPSASSNSPLNPTTPTVETQLPDPADRTSPSSSATPTLETQPPDPANHISPASPTSPTVETQPLRRSTCQKRQREFY